MDVNRKKTARSRRPIERDALLLTVTQAASRLALGRSLTYRLIQTGALRSIKIAGARRVLVSDPEAFVANLGADPAEAR